MDAAERKGGSRTGCAICEREAWASECAALVLELEPCETDPPELWLPELPPPWEALADELPELLAEECCATRVCEKSTANESVRTIESRIKALSGQRGKVGENAYFHRVSVRF